MNAEQHPNVTLFRYIYDAFTSGNIEELGLYFAEDVVWHTPGQHQLSDTYRGREATFDSFVRELDLAGGTYELQIHDVLANDEHIVALLHATAQREGRAPLDQNYVLIFHPRDGRIAEGWELWTDQAAVDAFWAETSLPRAPLPEVGK